MAQSVEPEGIVMDVIMPHKDGVEVCRDILALLPDTRAQMLTASTQENVVIEAVAAGATGYLQTYSGDEDLLAAVQDVAEGRSRGTGTGAVRAFQGPLSGRLLGGSRLGTAQPHGCIVSRGFWL